MCQSSTSIHPFWNKIAHQTKFASYRLRSLKAIGRNRWSFEKIALIGEMRSILLIRSNLADNKTIVIM
jgi:hypothetical protein